MAGKQTPSYLPNYFSIDDILATQVIRLPWDLMKNGIRLNRVNQVEPLLFSLNRTGEEVQLSLHVQSGLTIH